MVWKTFGHNNAKRILDLQISSGVFSHAYLFTGPESLGKKMLALELAKKILDANKLENHPDFSILNESEEISIERLRQFMDTLSFKPFLGKYKVAIFNDSQKLNVQSQNALLKTLEEPSPSTILILISSKTLLPTITSRCQVLNFNRFSQKQMLEFCSENGLEMTENFSNKMFGLPGKVLEHQVQSQAEENFWNKIKTSGSAEKLLEIGALAEKDTEELGKILTEWVQEQILSLSKNPKDYAVVHSLLEAKQNLTKNLNKKLVLQRLFLNIKT